MGRDKAQIRVDGTAMAKRVAVTVSAVCSPVLEVGPGVSDLPSVRETPVGEGPLVALACGAAALRRLGHEGAALVVACDLPFLQRDGIAELVSWPTEISVVPVVDGRPQPLCARWSERDLRVAEELIASGHRSMRALIDATHPTELVVGSDTELLRVEQLVDLDTPRDARGYVVADGDVGHPSVRSGP